MSKTTNERSEISQATIELMDLEILINDGNQIKGGPHLATFDGQFMSPTRRFENAEALELVAKDQVST